MVKKLALGLLLILALTSCSFFQVLPRVFGGGQSNTTSITNDTTGEEVTSPEDIGKVPEANPLKIEMVLDSTASVEKEVGQEGGYIVA